MSKPRKHILLVQADDRDALRYLLWVRGFEVLEARSESLALTALRHFPADVVLLAEDDFPESSDLLRKRMAALCPDLPVLRRSATRQAEPGDDFIGCNQSNGTLYERLRQLARRRCGRKAGVDYRV